MNDRDYHTIGYRAIRALVEDLLQPNAPTESITAALQEHLRQHCQHCGELLDRQPRQQGEQLCYACTAA